MKIPKLPLSAGVFSLALFISLTVARPAASQEKAWERGSPKVPPSPALQLTPIGRVERAGKLARLVLLPELAPALEGLEGFSHVWVVYWFHGNDRPEARATLRVHPRGNAANPLTGVFATRSPARPNLIGLAACRLLSIRGATLEVEGLDAWEDSPILDLKPYIPGIDSVPDARVPAWVKKMGEDGG